MKRKTKNMKSVSYTPTFSTIKTSKLDTKKSKTKTELRN